MIETKTTFILGAGASKPYNYHTAFELAKKIVDETDHHRNELHAELKNLGYETDDIKYFHDTLKESGENSVDSFLEYRNDKILWEIGKISMAYTLGQCELHSATKFTGFNELNNDNWYHHLYNSLRTSFEDFDKNNIRIVTFNYDRSFEEYLFSRLRTYGKSPEECAEKIENIPIVHLYGKLDNLPWENVDEDTKRKYGEIPRGEQLLSTSKNIQIIPEKESVESVESFQNAYELIESSEKIIFLGIDLLNEKNLDRLNIKNFLTPKRVAESERFDINHFKILSTGLGLRNEERKSVKQYFENDLYLGGSSQKSTLFLRDHVKL